MVLIESGCIYRMTTRITHLISGLFIGGAENALCSLVEGTQGKGFDHTVIVFLSKGEMQPRLERAGATVIVLGGRRGFKGALLFWSMARAIRLSKPDLVQSWMYHANVAALIARDFGVFRCPLIWNVRQSCARPELEKRLTRFLIKRGARLSGRANRIVYNSMLGAETHEAIGFAADRRCVIRNGIDSAKFCPDEAAGSRLREELGLPPESILVGRVARYAPMKDFETLLKAFREVAPQISSSYLVLVGIGCEDTNAELVDMCNQHGCTDTVLLMGKRLDLNRLYPAFDVRVSSSNANEGFPNVIAEGMACGNLIVTTAVGESVLINAACNIVVQPGDSSALAGGIVTLLETSKSDRKQFAEQGRVFVASNFPMSTCVEKYVRLWSELAPGPTRIKSAKLEPRDDPGMVCGP